MSVWIVRAFAAVAITALAAAAILYWPAEVAGAPAAPAPLPPGAQTPSQVSNARPEGSLTTVTLTPEAEVRLGVELATIERRNVQRTRMIGGEVIVPPGRSMTVSAPFAGVVAASVKGRGAGRGRAVVGRGRGSAHSAASRRRGRSAPARRCPLHGRESGQAGDAIARIARAGDVLARRDVGRRARRGGEGTRDSVESATAADESQYTFLESGKVSASDQTNAVILAAPRAGLLQNVHVSAGRVVALGEALFEIVAQNELWIKVPVYAGDMNVFDTAATTRAVSLGGRETGPGIALRPVSGPRTGDPRSASVDLFYAFDNGQGRFRPGERVRVTMPLRGASQGTVVPLSAIFRDIYDGAWVYENTAPRTYVRRRVNVLYVVNDVAVIGNGPPVGTKVVSAGVAELAGTEFGGSH